MKTNKTIAIAAGIFILATFIYIGIQHLKINKLTDQNQIQKVELSSLKDSISVYRDKNDSSTYKLSAVEVSNKNLKESLEIAGWDIKKLKERDIKWQKITAALRMEIAASGHVETNIRDTFRIEKTDTIYFSKVEDWNNKFLYLYKGEIVNQKLEFDYNYKTGISIIPTPVKNGNIVNVFMSDPKAEITSGNAIFLKSEKRWWEKPWLWGLAGLTTGIIISK